MQYVRFCQELFGKAVYATRVDAEKETVWLTQAEKVELFDVDRTRITRHVNSILHDGEVDAESNVRKTHFANADPPTNLYGLDMILAVGYRVNSKRGIAFEASTYEESSVFRCEIYVSPRDLRILNREYCVICSERFVQRFPHRALSALINAFHHSRWFAPIYRFRLFA